MNKRQFEREVVPMATKIYPFVARMVGKLLAEDCIQEIMCKLWENRRKLKKVDNIGGYVYRMANNHCINIIKREDKTINIDSVAEGFIPETWQSSDKKERYIFILKHIDLLKEPNKTVITLRDLDGLEFNEISAITGLTEINIRAIVSRSRHKIRDAFNRAFTENYNATDKQLKEDYHE